MVKKKEALKFDKKAISFIILVFIIGIIVGTSIGYNNSYTGEPIFGRLRGAFSASQVRPIRTPEGVNPCVNNVLRLFGNPTSARVRCEANQCVTLNKVCINSDYTTQNGDYIWYCNSNGKWSLIKEFCGDDIDNDCDGTVDEACSIGSGGSLSRALSDEGNLPGT